MRGTIMSSLSTATDQGFVRAQTTAAGLPIVYERAGSGFPLLLLHGWGGSARYWRGTLAALAGRHALFAPDLPGFGDSPPLPGPANAEALANAVVALADTLGLARFDLNGHSFCAGVAAHIAAHHPDRVRRLILTCFSTFRNELERRVVDQVHHVMALWMALRRPWMANRRLFYRAIGSRFFYRMPADDAALRASFHDFLKMDRRTALESAASSGSPAITATLRAITRPALLIGARQDRIMPPAGTPFAASLIPGCRLAWIERCGHLPMLERPAEYHRLVETFLVEDTP